MHTCTCHYNDLLGHMESCPAWDVAPYAVSFVAEDGATAFARYDLLIDAEYAAGLTVAGFRAAGIDPDTRNVRIRVRKDDVSLGLAAGSVLGAPRF